MVKLLTDNVNNPSHYKSTDVSYDSPECIHVTRNLSFCLGNAYKYVWRAGRKGEKIKEIEDLMKALWYIDDHLKHFGEKKNSVNSAAMQVFDLLQFPEDANEQHRKRSLQAILNEELKIAKAEVKSFISHFLWKDFSEPTDEELEAICGMIEEKELPPFIQNLKRRKSIEEQIN